jgi:hypothetical protein
MTLIDKTAQTKTETITFGKHSWAATPSQKRSWDEFWKKVLAQVAKNNYTSDQVDMGAA